MISPGIPQVGNWNFLKLLFKASAPSAKPAQQAAPAEDTLHEQEFILDMMQSRPEAFQSDLDVQYVMQYYPSRF